MMFRQSNAISHFDSHIKINSQTYRRMPYSSEIFDIIIQQKLVDWGYHTYLDIGAGAGKYGKLIRSIFPLSDLTAVEIEPDYVIQFNLSSIYSRVVKDDIHHIIEGKQDAVYDLVIFGDVIEHLPKSVGTDLIHYLSYRCRKMLVIYPAKYIQYAVDGRKSESHRSVWAPLDFAHFTGEHHSKSFMNMSIIDGYLGDPNATGLDSIRK